MRASLNIFALLAGLTAFARWTIYYSTATRRVGWRRWLGGVGILAFFFSVVSPDDDAFQQELIRPTSPKLSAHTRIGPQGPVVHLSIDASAAAEGSILAFKRGRLFIMEQPFDGLTHFQAPTSIHSPPIAS